MLPSWHASVHLLFSAEPRLAEDLWEASFNGNPPKSPVTWTTAQVLRHRCTTRFPPMPQYAVSVLHVGPVPGTSSACLVQHGAQDTRASCYTPTGGRFSPATSRDQMVVFTTHVYKNALYFCMDVCFFY